MNNNVFAIILAAGEGKRLKSIGPKPLLIYRERTFLENIVNKLMKNGLTEVIVVTNRRIKNQIVKLKLNATILVNPNPEQGMLSSLLIGMKEVDFSCSGFFLCPIDYPLVKKETYHKLLIAHQSDPERIIKPAFEFQSGHPIILPKNLFQALREAPLDRGARFVTRKYAHLTEYVPVKDQGVLINVNTPQLYHQYCK